jgi:hypothetical protein
MPVSDAYSAATASPRAAMSASWWRIIADKMPRRRWLGRTATKVTPAAPVIPPGTVSWNEYAAVVPTIASPSNAAMLRSNSKTRRSCSLSSGDWSLSLNAWIGTSQ